MNIPPIIEFDSNCLIVLRKSLLASIQQENCALLIGSQTQSTTDHTKSLYRIRLIWPFSNIWEPSLFNFIQSSKNTFDDSSVNLSKRNRFAIDPKEQILAQKWARRKNWKVLGTAHSHPYGETVPSTIDREMSFASGLMVIVNGFGDIGTWWIANDQNFKPLQLTYQNDE